MYVGIKVESNIIQGSRKYMFLCFISDIDFNMSVDYMCWFVFIVYDLIKIFYIIIIIFGFFWLFTVEKNNFFVISQSIIK